MNYYAFGVLCVAGVFFAGVATVSLLHLFRRVRKIARTLDYQQGKITELSVCLRKQDRSTLGTEILGAKRSPTGKGYGTLHIEIKHPDHHGKSTI
jgi:hypothetical protein